MQRQTYKSNFGKNVSNPKGSARLDKPWIVGYMSVDVLREYHHNLSQLKYLTSIPTGQLHLDLNHNIEKAVKRTTGSSDEKISLLLKFLLDQKQRLDFFNHGDIFISYRRTLISVMCNIYDCTPVTILATLFNNCIYLCSLELPQKVKKRPCNDLDKFCAWGYKYEQFMLSDLPGTKPQTEKPILENEEFSIYYCTQLANHRLFYGAQIDGMMATADSTTEIPNTNEVDANLTFLRQNGFVELKTQRELYQRQQVHNFKKYKLMRCWCQCFLAGLDGLLVGYRNDEGIIHRVEWFNTVDIVRFCKGVWDPQKTLNFLDRVLNFIKESFNDMKTTLGHNYELKVPVTLKFDIDEHQKFTVCETEDSAHIILPSWYIQGVV